jgi:hypothetical protein
VQVSQYVGHYRDKDPVLNRLTPVMANVGLLLPRYWKSPTRHNRLYRLVGEKYCEDQCAIDQKHWEELAGYGRRQYAQLVNLAWSRHSSGKAAGVRQMRLYQAAEV